MFYHVEGFLFIPAGSKHVYDHMVKFCSGFSTQEDNDRLSGFHGAQQRHASPSKHMKILYVLKYTELDQNKSNQIESNLFLLTMSKTIRNPSKT